MAGAICNSFEFRALGAHSVKQATGTPESFSNDALRSDGCASTIADNPDFASLC